MRLREFYIDRFHKMLFKFSILILILSVVFSLNLYLKKVHTSQEQDLRQLESIRTKLLRLNEFKVSLDKFSSKESQNSEIKLAEFLDSISRSFPELKIELSTQRRENEISYLPFVIKAEGSFIRFLEVVDFLDRTQYPICLVNSVSLKSKEKTLSFEIKGEIGLLK